MGRNLVSLGIDLLIFYTKEQFFYFKEELLAEHPEYWAEIKGKITYVEPLYKCLADFGVIPGVAAASSQKLAFENLIDVMLKQQRFYSEQAEITQMLANDATCDAIVLSIGSAHNIEEMMPSFIKDLGKKVKVLNIDHCLTAQDRELVQQRETADQSALFYKILFPSTYKDSSTGLVPQHQKVALGIHQAIIDNYIATIIAKKDYILLLN